MCSVPTQLQSAGTPTTIGASAPNSKEYSVNVQSSFKVLEDKILEDASTGWDKRFDNIVHCMHECANGGDARFTQLRTKLSECADGPDSHAYRGAVGDYVRTMARTGDHHAALSAACVTAGIPEPPTESGVSPIDQVIKDFRTSGSKPDVKVVKPLNGLQKAVNWLFKPPTESK